MIAFLDQWGPFAPDLRPAERVERLRALRAITRLLLGPAGEGLTKLLALSEIDPDPSTLRCAVDLINAMPSLDRRKILASYGALNRPA
ncbi:MULTISPECIES: hypothetical protein [unclassified Methylobacterium]|uniref:hypothetical protein n=1 Tax=unclassified Methylobacterium TaxID=2615210 RepID=UPI00226AFCC8|nr:MULTISPECIES: hypothetical protein [unclassified Methylobacterium]